MKCIISSLAVFLLLSGAVPATDRVDVRVSMGDDPNVDTVWAGMPASLDFYFENDAAIEYFITYFRIYSEDGTAWTWNQGFHEKVFAFCRSEIITDPNGYEDSIMWPLITSLDLLCDVAPSYVDIWDTYMDLTGVPGSRMYPPYDFWDYWEAIKFGLEIEDSTFFDGISPDKFSIRGAKREKPYMSPGPLEHNLSMHFTATASESDEITTICIDTIETGVEGGFGFFCPGVGVVFPEVLESGRRCWPVKTRYPTFTDYRRDTIIAPSCRGVDVELETFDPEGDPIHFIISTPDAEVDSETGILTYIPPNPITETFTTISVTPCDASGCGVSKEITFRIINQDPELICGPTIDTTFAGHTYVRNDILVTDADECDIIHFALCDGPGEIDPITGRYQWDIPPNDSGTHTIEIRATDNYPHFTASRCSYSLKRFICEFQIEVIPEDAITIAKLEGIRQGHYVDVPVSMYGVHTEMGGFEFLIAYDAPALMPVEIATGELTEKCDWEYFTYRFGADGNCGDACPSGLLRIIALAETDNGPYHPSCYSPPDTDPYKLAVMKFYVTNDRTFECQYVPIRFFWGDCNDNAVSSIGGDTLWLARMVHEFDGSSVYLPGDYDQLPGWFGPPDFCLEGDKTAPIRWIDFYNGGLDIVCGEDIDARADINCNGVANEIADAVMLTNYFVEGLAAFDDHVEASIAASDVNADGLSLSVADLVYLVRVIVGDALPYAKPRPFSETATVTMQTDHTAVDISIDSPTDIGAGLFVFEYEGTIGQPELGDNSSAMSLNYVDEGGRLKVLIYSLEKDAKIPAGSVDILSLPVIGEGKISLTEVQLSDYYGNLLNTRIDDRPAIPSSYVLHQNYPNPFNAATTISYQLPTAGHVRLDIFNVLGQLVTTILDGYEPAGIHSIDWNGLDESGSTVSSGIYFYRLTADGFTAKKKMILMK